MNKREYIQRAIDANAFIYNAGFNAEAATINPTIWDRQLREYEEKALVITQFAEVFDFRGAGADYTVTIDERPTAAGALTETTDVAIKAFGTRQITFTPSEQGDAYQLTRAEAVRAFFNVAERMTKKLAYSMAERKDSLALTELYANAGNAIFANSKTAATNLASTDTLNLVDISRAIYENRKDLYRSEVLIINPALEHQLRTQTSLITLADASQFGTRQTIANGVVGEVLGLKVVVSDLITKSGNVTKALVLGTSRTGEKSFGYAIKRDPMIEQEYHALGRRWDIVGHEEYDFAVMHPDAICTLSVYEA